jgi:hypothetical protein
MNPIQKMPKMKYMKWLMISLVAFTIPAQALTVSVPKCNHDQFEGIRHLTHYFHKVDPRQTFKQYAKSTGQSLKEVKQQFSATGRLKCYDTANGSYEVITANVVGRNNLITGAAHVFFNDNCSPRSVGRCEFYTINQPKQVYKIKVNTAVIKDCVRIKGNSLDDWFVAELTGRTSATPYLIPDSPIRPAVGDQLLLVAAKADNGFANTPNLVNCSVMNTDYRLAPYLTDCSTGHGSSGGAHLQPASGHRWTINAIVSGESPTGRDGGEFNVHGGGYTTSAPVNGEFWQTLHDMSNADEITTTRDPHDRDSY